MDLKKEWLGKNLLIQNIILIKNLSTLEFSDISDGLLHGNGYNLVAICKTDYSIDELIDWTIVPNCSYEFN